MLLSESWQWDANILKSTYHSLGRDSLIFAMMGDYLEEDAAPTRSKASRSRVFATLGSSILVTAEIESDQLSYL